MDFNTHLNALIESESIIKLAAYLKGDCVINGPPSNHARLCQLVMNLLLCFIYTVMAGEKLLSVPLKLHVIVFA